MTTVLLVEDDERIAEPLLFGLREEGYQAVHAATGRRALELLRTARPDLILLDVMLPDVDGFTVCRTIRKESDVPVLMVTARGQEVERVMGLEIGADDYIVKPFGVRELLARVRAALRRRAMDRGAAPAPEDRLSAGDLVVDRAARRAWRSGRPLALRQREFDLLCALLARKSAAVSRQELLDLVWGEQWIGDPHTLDVHIRWLREKIEDDPSAPRLLRTVRGFGYRLADPGESSAEPA